jgi:PleD family two-component response regulator
LTISSSSNNAETGRKILLVDDEADVVSTFKMILEMNNFEVDGYTNPLFALSNFKPNEFGLLILDIKMPVMNGFELFKRIKEIDNRVQACFITAYEDYRNEFKDQDIRIRCITIPHHKNVSVHMTYSYSYPELGLRFCISCFSCSMASS